MRATDLKDPKINRLENEFYLWTKMFAVVERRWRFVGENPVSKNFFPGKTETVLLEMKFWEVFRSFFLFSFFSLSLSLKFFFFHNGEKGDGGCFTHNRPFTAASSNFANFILIVLRILEKFAGRSWRYTNSALIKFSLFRSEQQKPQLCYKEIPFPIGS